MPFPRAWAAAILALAAASRVDAQNLEFKCQASVKGPNPSMQLSRPTWQTEVDANRLRTDRSGVTGPFSQWVEAQVTNAGRPSQDRANSPECTTCRVLAQAFGSRMQDIEGCGNCGGNTQTPANPSRPSTPQPPPSRPNVPRPVQDGENTPNTQKPSVPRPVQEGGNKPQPPQPPVDPGFARPPPAGSDEQAADCAICDILADENGGDKSGIEACRRCSSNATPSPPRPSVPQQPSQPGPARPDLSKLPEDVRNALNMERLSSADVRALGEAIPFKTLEKIVFDLDPRTKELAAGIQSNEDWLRGWYINIIQSMPELYNRFRDAVRQYLVPSSATQPATPPTSQRPSQPVTPQRPPPSRPVYDPATEDGSKEEATPFQPAPEDGAVAEACKKCEQLAQMDDADQAQLTESCTWCVSGKAPAKSTASSSSSSKIPEDVRRILDKDSLSELDVRKLADQLPYENLEKFLFDNDSETKEAAAELSSSWTRDRRSRWYKNIIASNDALYDSLRDTVRQYLLQSGASQSQTRSGRATMGRSAELF